MGTKPHARLQNTQEPFGRHKIRHLSVGEHSWGMERVVNMGREGGSRPESSDDGRHQKNFFHCVIMGDRRLSGTPSTLIDRAGSLSPGAPI